MNTLQENKDLQPVDVNDDQPESLMFIETVQHNELNVTLIFYICTISLSLIIGLLIQSPTESHISNCFVIDEQASFSFSLSPLNIFNQYLYSDFTVKIIDITKKQLIHSQFNVDIKGYESNQLIKNMTYSSFIHPVFPTRKSIFSAPQRFYFDNSIYFDSIVFKINFYNLSDNIELISIRTINTRKSTFIFNFLLKSFLMIFQIMFLIITYKKLKKEPYYHKEQKMSFILTTLCVFYDIPLWMIYRYFRIFDIFFTSLFHSFLKIYPISILAIFREPYMLKPTNSQATQAFFFIFLFFAEFMHQSISDISLLQISNPVSSKAGALISFELGLNLIYITWLIVAIISTSTKTKGTDIFRNNYFCCIIAVSLLVFIISNSSLTIRDRSKCSVREFIEFYVSNIFVLIVAYIHWPISQAIAYYTQMKEDSVDLLESEDGNNE